MIKPKHLCPGDTIAIVSLSAGTLGESWAIHKLHIARQRLEQDYRLKVKVMPNALKGRQYLYEHPEARAADWMQAFRDPEVKAIFNAIGVENVKIYATRGNGVIDGRADLVLKSYNDQKAKGYISASTPVPTLLYFENCKNIKLQKFLYRNPATPGKFYEAVNSDVTVEGCFTDTRD